MADESRYGTARVLAVWLAATSVLAALAWGAVPALGRITRIPGVKLYWLMLPLSALFQAVLVFQIARREAGASERAALLQRLRLSPPRKCWPIAAWGAAFLLAALLSLVLALFVTFAPVENIRWAALIAMLSRPLNFFELASPSFAGQWLWLPVVLISWSAAAIAEECLFRGLLLPRMRGGFTNGLLFALYSAASPWTMPLRWLTAPMIVRPARKHASTWMSLGVRGVEGLVIGGFLLAGIMSPRFSPITRTERRIVRVPEPADFHRGKSTALPVADYSGTRDFRGRDISSLDLRKINPAMASFDDRTVWPASDRLPAAFDRERIVELGKDPGLGVRALHAQGVTGRDIGIGIIDKFLLTGHQEYKDRLEWYEEVGAGSLTRAQMHAATVSSVAVGRTVGVAPGARLYFIGTPESPLSLVQNFGQIAQGLRRLIELNRVLPSDRKIRVVSISIGWSPGQPGFDDIESAVYEAKATGIFVVSSSLERDYGFRYHGLGRNELADPDHFESCEPGLFWARVYDLPWSRNRVLIPMDSRTTASPTGDGEYVFYRAGGWSWAAPYIAGVYALAAQVDPAITPERFWKLVCTTGRWVDYKGKPFGPIINPPAVIEALRR